MNFQDINNYRNQGRSNVDIATDVARSDPSFGQRWDSVTKMNIPTWKKEVMAREGLNKWYGGNTQKADETSNTISNAGSSAVKQESYKNPAWITNIWNGIYTSATAPGEVMQGVADIAGNALAQPVRAIMGKTEPAKGLFFDPNTPQIQNLRQNTLNTLDSASLYGGIIGAPFGATALGSAGGQAVSEIGKDIMGENRNTALQQVGDIALAGAFGKIAGSGQGGIYQTGARMAAGQAVTEAGKTALGNNPNVVYKNNGDIDYIQTAKNMSSSVAQSATAGMAIHGVAGVVAPTIAGVTKGGFKGGIEGLSKGAGNIYSELSNPVSVLDTFSTKQSIGDPANTDAQKMKQYKDTIAKISQETDPKRIDSISKGLEEINTKGVRTYEDLQTVTDNSIRPLMDLAEEIRTKFPTPKPLSELTIKYKDGTKSITVNPVENAINHLQELYSQNGDYKAYVKLQNFKEKAHTAGLSPSEVNALAVEYGKQRRGFSDATGRPLTSVNGQLYESTRSQLKQVSRDMVPDKILAIIDQKIHNMLDLKSNVESIVAKVQQLKNKVETRGLLERASRLTMKLIDTATFHSLRGAAQAIFPSNVGTKQMNYLQIEEALTNNLKKFEKLSKDVQKMNDVQAAKAINKYVTENIAAPQYKMQKEALDQYLGVDSSTLTPEELAQKIAQKQSNQVSSQSQSEAKLQEANTLQPKLQEKSSAVNIPNEDNIPLSQFSPKGVKDAKKMDVLTKGGMTAPQAAKAINNFPNLTPEEILRLTPEEKATGQIGGSDYVQPVSPPKQSPKVLPSEGATKGEVFYHGTSGDFDTFDISKTGAIQHSDWGKGVYLTPSNFEADEYAKMAAKSTGKPKRVMELTLADEAKVATHYSRPGTIADSSLADDLAEQGYDAVKIYRGPPGDEDTFLSEVIVMNPKAIRSNRLGLSNSQAGGKPQLAQKKSLRQSNTIPKELEPIATEARKYKSAEEFVRSKEPTVPEKSLSKITDESNLIQKEINKYFDNIVKDVAIKNGYSPKNKMIFMVDENVINQAEQVLEKDSKYQDLLNKRSSHNKFNQKFVNQHNVWNKWAVSKSQLTDIWNKAHSK